MVAKLWKQISPLFVVRKGNSCVNTAKMIIIIMVIIRLCHTLGSQPLLWLIKKTERSVVCMSGSDWPELNPTSAHFLFQPAISNKTTEQVVPSRLSWNHSSNWISIRCDRYWIILMYFWPFTTSNIWNMRNCLTFLEIFAFLLKVNETTDTTLTCVC